MKSQIAILCFLGVAALAASQDPTFPFDALKWGFAKGAIMSDVSICSMMGVPDTSGDVTLYWDYAAGKMHSIVGCGAVADAHSFLLCGPNGPAGYGALCRSGNCSCFPTIPRDMKCPPPQPIPTSVFSFVGTRDWYGDVKANRWQVTFVANGTAFIYTSGNAVVGWEVYRPNADAPFMTVIFKKWDVTQPDEVDFELPDSCPKTTAAQTVFHAAIARHSFNAAINSFPRLLGFSQ